MPLMRRSWDWYVGQWRQHPLWLNLALLVLVAWWAWFFILGIGLLYEVVRLVDRGRLTSRARWATATVAFLVVLLLVNAVNGTSSPAASPSAGPEGSQVAAAEASASTIAATASVTIPAVTSVSTPTPAPTRSSPTQTPKPTESPKPTAAPTPTPAPTPVLDFTPIKLSGRGDKIARFSIPEDKAALATISYTGTGNFAIWTIGSDGSELDLLVNTIGKYSGTRMFDTEYGQHSVAFKITASGSWVITVKPVELARVWNGTTKLSGRGDDVVQLAPPSSGLVTLAVTHTGSENFAVRSYGGSGVDLLVNEIGRYSGEVLLPTDTNVIEVIADGAWTMTPQ